MGKFLEFNKKVSYEMSNSVMIRHLCGDKTSGTATAHHMHITHQLITLCEVIKAVPNPSPYRIFG